MACRNPLEERPAPRGQMNLDPSSVLAAAAFADQLRGDTAADQCGRPVRTRLEPLGQLPHARPIPVRKAAQMEQQKILGRHYAGGTRGAFAEALKGRQPAAEV